MAKIPTPGDRAVQARGPACAAHDIGRPGLPGVPELSGCRVYRRAGGDRVDRESGNQTISTPGTVVSGWDVRGKLIINAANVTVKDSIIHGPAAGGCSNGAALEINAGGAQITDVEVTMDNPTARLDGVWTFGDNATLTRVHVHGGVDGVKTGSGVLIQDSYIHGIQWFASDPNQGGGETHNDGVQTFAGDRDVTLQHNRIDVSTTNDSNAAWQTSGVNIRAENNYLADGGGCTLNVDAKSLGGPTLQPVYVNNNRFGRHQASTGCVVLISNKTVMTEYNGNLWADTLTAVPRWQQHD